MDKHTSINTMLSTINKGTPAFVSDMKELEGSFGAYWRPIVNEAAVLSCPQNKVEAELKHALLYAAKFGARKHDVANGVAWAVRKHLRSMARNAINTLALRAMAVGQRGLDVQALEVVAIGLEAEYDKYEAHCTLVHQWGADAVFALEHPTADGGVGEKPWEGVDELDDIEGMSLEEQADALLRASGFFDDEYDMDDMDDSDDDDDEPQMSRRDRDILSVMRAPEGAVQHKPANVMKDATTVEKTVWMPANREQWVEYYAHMSVEEIATSANFAAGALFKQRYEEGIKNPHIEDAFFTHDGGRIPAKASAGLLKLRTKRISLRYKLNRLLDRQDAIADEIHRYESSPELVTIAAMHNAKLDDELVELKPVVNDTTKQLAAVEALLGQLEPMVKYLTWDFPFDIVYSTTFVVDPMAALAHEVARKHAVMGMHMSLKVAAARVREALGSPEVETFEATNERGEPITLHRITYRKKHLAEISRAFVGADATAQAEAFIAEAMSTARYRVGATDKAQEAIRELERVSGAFATRNRKISPTDAATFAAELVGDLDDLL